MVVRGFAVMSLAVKCGSELMNIRCPVSSTTFAICALAPGAKAVAQKASVARRSPAVYTVRLRIMPLGKAHNNFGLSLMADSVRHGRVAVNATSVLGPPPGGHPWGRLPSDLVRLAYPRLLEAYCLPSDTVLALDGIIAMIRLEMGHSARPSLGQLCPFRQPRPNRACRPRNRPPVSPVPVSACQHGL